MPYRVMQMIYDVTPLKVLCTRFFCLFELRHPVQVMARLLLNTPILSAMQAAASHMWAATKMILTSC